MPSQQNEQTSKDFVLAAKECEIATLVQLADTCEMVTGISGLIHHLQRERALSNIHLVSSGQHLSDHRQQQIDICRASEQHLRALFCSRYLESRPDHASMQLLNTIALVMQGMENLESLRSRVTRMTISAEESTIAFRRLIAGLLSVVFDAADVASNPVITRTLVALFSFMQSKEYAGQERAWGSIGFANGKFSKEWGERIEQLQEMQESGFQDFVRFCGADLEALWQSHCASACEADLNRLRSMITRLCQGESIDSEISEVWYKVATARIDALGDLEKALTRQLLEQCQQQLATARHELDHQQARLSDPAIHQTPMTLLFDTKALPFTDNFISRTTVSPDAACSVYELMLGQAEQIKQMSRALAEARRTLDERKTVERAKGLLMQQLGLSEEQAYSKMRERAMARNMRLAELARALIEAAHKS